MVLDGRKPGVTMHCSGVWVGMNGGMAACISGPGRTRSGKAAEILLLQKSMNKIPKVILSFFFL